MCEIGFKSTHSVNKWIKTNDDSAIFLCVVHPIKMQQTLTLLSLLLKFEHKLCSISPPFNEIMMRFKQKKRVIISNIYHVLIVLKTFDRMLLPMCGCYCWLFVFFLPSIRIYDYCCYLLCLLYFPPLVDQLESNRKVIIGVHFNMHIYVYIFNGCRTLTSITIQFHRSKIASKFIYSLYLISSSGIKILSIDIPHKVVLTVCLYFFLCSQIFYCSSISCFLILSWKTKT